MVRLRVYVTYFPAHCAGITNMPFHYDLSPLWRYITQTGIWNLAECQQERLNSCNWCLLFKIPVTNRQVLKQCLNTELCTGIWCIIQTQIHKYLSSQQWYMICWYRSETGRGLLKNQVRFVRSALLPYSSASYWCGTHLCFLVLSWQWANTQVFRTVDNTSSITYHYLPSFYTSTNLYCLVTEVQGCEQLA